MVTTLQCKCNNISKKINNLYNFIFENILYDHKTQNDHNNMSKPFIHVNSKTDFDGSVTLWLIK